MNQVNLKELNIVGYARKSKVEKKRDKEEEKKILSIEDQLKWSDEYMLHHGLCYFETGEMNPMWENKSAYNPGREEFNKMVALIQAGIYNCIITYHISRLSRNPQDSGTIKQLVKDGKLKAIITPEYIYYNNSNDKLVLNVQFMLAEKGSDDTSDYVKRDIQGKIDRQEFPTMVCAPYLNIDKKGVIAGESYNLEKAIMLSNLNRPLKRVELDPVEAPLWRQLGEEIIKDRLSLNQAQQRAHTLHLMGTYSDKPIVKSTIRNTFKNPFLYGMMRVQGSLFPGNHEPLFSRDEWELINEILTDKKKTRIKDKIKKNYNNLCVCGECERGVTTEPPKRHGKIYLRCSKSRKDYKCSQKYLELTEFEKQIEEQLKELQLSKRLIHWIVKQLQEGNEFETDRNRVLAGAVSAKLKQIDVEFDAYRRRWSSPTNLNGELISDEEYKNEKEKYQKEREDLEKQLKKLNIEKEGWIDEVEEFFLFARDLYLDFHEKKDDIDSKKRLLNMIASNITIKDKNAVINYNNKYSVIKKLKDTKVETIPNFERLSAYDEAINPVYQPIMEKVRRG